jgi:formylglycine-generating enzyme required for sulfatase activity
VNESFGVVVGEINEISDRATLGLPESYRRPAAAELGASLESLVGSSPAELVRTAEGSREPLERRLAAGLLLAGLGDPRIRVFEPQLIEIPGGAVRVGLDPVEVDEVVAAYASLGVVASWIEKECPRHEITLAPYAIAKYPVTNLEYVSFLEDTGFSTLPSSWKLGRFGHLEANLPVYSVSHESAEAYAAWLSRRTGRRFRLPSEAEWEYAAAGPEARDFPWGDAFDPNCCNTAESGLLMASPVGCFPQGCSAWGVADMAGNVEECVSDFYAAYPGGRFVEDDLYLESGDYRVCRGGSFSRFRDLARCTRRHGPFPRSLYAIGFRLASDPSG